MITDHKQATYDAMRPWMALYIGGMGAKEQNFHIALFALHGLPARADEIQALFLQGRKEAAAALVPDELISEVTIVGNLDEVREQVKRWEEPA